MASIFKSVFRSEKTAVLNPPAEVSADISAPPPKSSDSGPAAVVPATEPAAPAPNDEAVLQDFLLRNFLLDEPPADTAKPEFLASSVYVPDPLPEPSTEQDVTPIAIKAANPVASPMANLEANPVINPEASPTTSPVASPITVTLTEPEKDVVADTHLMAADATPEPPKIDSGEWALEEALANHKDWLDSHAATGGKADLQKVQLEGRELIGVNLRYADLQDANLKSADLLLADLRDACLVRANLQETRLVGINLEGANLEGAALESAMGLLPRQLAGANLHEASLPGTILEFNALAEFQRTSLTAARLFATTLVVSLLSCLTIWKTKDVQLLTDSAIIPYLHSSAAAPTDEIYLIAPAALLAIYLWLLYNLQRVWDAV